jgi:HD-like signal output (HDOD) protein
MQVSALFEQANKLPHIPEVVKELIQSFNDDSVNADHVAKKISMDQVLSAKVLRMANSAHYGGARNISSTNDAVVMLGFSALRTLVLASGLTSAFEAPEGFDLNAFWKRSFAEAGISKWLAKGTDIDPETAFTCTMMHRIGTLMIYAGMPHEAASIDKTLVFGGNRESVEQGQLGFTFADVGEELASRWKFPEDICLGIKHQCHPMNQDEFSSLAGLINLSDSLFEMLEKNQSNQDIERELSDELIEKLNINKDRIITDIDTAKALLNSFDDMTH